MLAWTEKYRGWEGTAAELADVVRAIATEIQPQDGGSWANERLVRHYVQVGIIGRPERRGKEAYFGFRQLVELLAARVLLNDGWPLLKIADFVRLTDDDGLLGLFPTSGPLTPAQELVRKFQRSGAPRSPGPKPPPVNPMRRSVDLLKQRHEAFPHGTLPEIESWLRIELTPFCHVYIEREAANHTPPELIDQLSRALTQALIEFIRRGDRK